MLNAVQLVLITELKNTLIQWCQWGELAPLSNLTIGLNVSTGRYYKVNINYIVNIYIDLVDFIQSIHSDLLPLQPQAH